MKKYVEYHHVLGTVPDRTYPIKDETETEYVVEHDGIIDRFEKSNDDCDDDYLIIVGNQEPWKCYTYKLKIEDCE